MNQPPVVSIANPTDGSSYTINDTVVLTGTATDAEDGDISTNVDWTSNIEGALGTGESLSVTGLMLGNHIITAEVSDSAGTTVSDTVSITITNATLATPDMLAPNDIQQPTAPTFQWTAVAGATDYELAIYNIGTDTLEWTSTHSAAAAGCGNGTGTCSIQPAGISLQPGGYTWLVRATDGTTFSDWAIYSP